jgi:thiol-disulfide isomerase/thioredoxin
MIRAAAMALLMLAPALLQAGQPLPALDAKDLQGKPFSLAGLKGKVVLLDFWASWCGPCRKSLPFIDQLQTRYGSQGFQAVGVALDEDPEAMTAFLERTPVRFTIVPDGTGRSAEAFGVVAMPTTFLIDQEGRVVARFEGGEHLKAEEEAVATLLKKGPQAPMADVRVAAGLRATGPLKPWRRGHLADPIMNLDGDRLTSVLREHIHASKEGAAGNGGAAGGGCGCN